MTKALKEEWKKVREEVRGEVDEGWDLAEDWHDALKDEDGTYFRSIYSPMRT